MNKSIAKQSLLRRVIMIGVPVILGALEITHPVHFKPTGVYDGLHDHVDWWIFLHVIQLALFGMIGLIMYWLVKDIQGIAATICRISTASFVILYNAFDALVGLGNGILIKYTSWQPEEKVPLLKETIDVFWTSEIATLVTALAVTSWMMAVLSLILARSESPKRWPGLLLAAIALPFGLLSYPLGIYGTFMWWVGILLLAAGFALVSKHRLSMALLTISAVLFATSHTAPYGPPAMMCFVLAVVLLEQPFTQKEQQQDASFVQ
jgi:hypothetical protein